MLHELKLPESGMGITEGTVLKWITAEGDAIRAGEALAEVEPANALEIAAPGATAGVKATIALLREG